MKTLLRIPTPRTPDKEDRFGYIEFEFEGTPDEAIEEYERLTAILKGEAGTGLDSRVYNGVLDEYLTTGSISNGADLYAQMSKDQQNVIQEIKKSHKRTNK
jgi:phage tail tape-measure protein